MIRTGSFPNDPVDTTCYILEDHLGSSNVRLDTNGSVIDKEEYYPFGDSSLRTWSKKRYRFCGKEKDSESGLYYYGMRYYAAWTCRFISVDPLAGKYPFYTPYQYAGNKPINFIDLDGAEEAEASDKNNKNEIVKAGDKIYGDDGSTYIASIDEIIIEENANKDTSIPSSMTKYLKFAPNIPTYPTDNGMITKPPSKFKRVLYNVKHKFSENIGVPLMFTSADDVTTILTGYHTDLTKASKSEKYWAFGSLPFFFIGGTFAKKLFKRIFTKAAKGSNLVKIGTIEDDVMTFSAKIGDETVEGISNFAVKDGKLYLNELHLQGASAGNVGRQGLWDMAKDLGRQYNVKEVVIQGGKRTTGKYKGQVPSPITIKVD